MPEYLTRRSAGDRHAAPDNDAFERRKDPAFHAVDSPGRRPSRPIRMLRSRRSPLDATLQGRAAETGLGAEGIDATWVHTDVTDPDQIEHVADVAARHPARLAAWVNNAGRALVKDSLTITVDEWDDVFRTNVRSVFFGAQAAARIMIGNGGGVIVNVSSIQGLIGSSVQGDPTLMRRVNGWFTIFWVVMIPVSLITGWISSVAYMVALSLWALVSGHWSAWQAARVEVAQQAEEPVRGRTSTCQPLGGRRVRIAVDTGELEHVRPGGLTSRRVASGWRKDMLHWPSGN